MLPQVLPEGISPDFVELVNGIYYDLCVMCKDNTGVPTNHPVDQRKHYIGGCGQLCEDCYDKADFMT